MSENADQIKSIALSEAQIAHQLEIFRALIINLILLLKEPMASYEITKIFTMPLDGEEPTSASCQTSAESALPTRKEVGDMLLAEELWLNPSLSYIHPDAVKAANVLLKALLELPKDLVIR
jgi:hypothetical protein